MVFYEKVVCKSGCDRMWPHAALADHLVFYHKYVVLFTQILVE